MKILIINGPNLNLLGKREPSVYGSESFEQYFDKLKSNNKNIEISYEQSNHEGVIIDLIQGADETFDGVILNAGGYTHTSIAIADAIAAVEVPVVEVHVSNIYNREEFRKRSYLTPACCGIIAGFGLRSYELALEYFKN